LSSSLHRLGVALGAVFISGGGGVGLAAYLGLLVLLPLHSPFRASSSIRFFPFSFLPTLPPSVYKLRAGRFDPERSGFRARWGVVVVGLVYVRHTNYRFGDVVVAMRPPIGVASRDVLMVVGVGEVGAACWRGG